jgi:hypothetical protein
MNAATTYAVEPATDWHAVANQDASLRAFVDAEVGRAGVAESAWRCEAERWRDVAERQAMRLEELQTSDERARRGNRERQTAHRRRSQFAPPLTEEM